jgi:hypothetical protein
MCPINGPLVAVGAGYVYMARYLRQNVGGSLKKN